MTPGMIAFPDSIEFFSGQQGDEPAPRRILVR